METKSTLKQSRLYFFLVTENIVNFQTKTLINFVVTAQLLCTFVFTYAMSLCFFVFFFGVGGGSAAAQW